MSIQYIAKKITEMYPLEVAQTEWDNVGVLIDTGSVANNLMVTIDITREVIKECNMYGIRNIVSYHPIIFRPIMSLKQSDLVTSLVKNNINVFCPHTSWDPAINEYIYNLFNKDRFINNSGNNKWSIGKVIEKLKKVRKVNHLRMALAKTHFLETVPPKMVVGAGAAFKYHKYFNSLIIRGEMDHHVILHSLKQGNTVILLEHSNSERIALQWIFYDIIEALPDYECQLSEADVDPIEII